MAMVSSDQDREEEEEEDDDSMKCRKIPGLKFKPTDEMLADYYLRKKAAGKDDGICKCIRKEEIYEYQPSELSSRAYDFGDGKKRMYFVTALKMKHVNGTNVDRSTKDNIGFWKITGKISFVKKDGREIASKTALAYYINKTSDKPEKSQWLMKEYRLIEDQSNEESERLALCVIYFHDTKSGKGVREEKNKQSSVYEKGEGSNSKTIATEAASSSLPPTENSNHQDILESSVSIPIANSDQNMSVMGSQYSLERWAPIVNSDQNTPAMGSQCTLESWTPIANYDQNMPAMGSQYTPESSAPIANSDQNLPVMGSQYTLESWASIANSDQNMPVMGSQYTFESSAPIANSDQNMPVMGSQYTLESSAPIANSDQQYTLESWAPIATSDQNMPVMGSQYTFESSAPVANSDQNMPVIGSQYTLESSAPIANSDQQYTLESWTPIANSDQNMPVMRSQYTFERWAPIAISDQNMPVMGSQYTLESSAPIANSDQNLSVMGSQGSNYPYQNMPYPVMGSQSSNFVQNIPNQVMGLHGATATDSNLQLQSETIADIEQLLLRTKDNCGYQTWKRTRF